MKTRRLVLIMSAVLTGILMFGVPAFAAEIIPNGVTFEGIDMSGKTLEAAETELHNFASQVMSTQITINTVDNNSIQVTAKDLGFQWINQDVLEETVNYSSGNNIVQRYKAKKDLEHNGKDYQLEYTIDKNKIAELVAEQAAMYDQKATDGTLRREEDHFVIEGGNVGYVVDQAVSSDQIYDSLTNSWDFAPLTVSLTVKEDVPRGSANDLSMIKDVLGTFTTSYTSSGSSRSANVANGCSLVNGTMLYPGDEFSMYNTIAPFSSENGYYMAGSYLNGQVVESLGGGICQVSTTLYNAVLLAELEVTERHNHSMIVNYVDPSADAAISESAGKDFRFVNNLDYPIYIEGKTADKHITFTIYGVETRPASHEVAYVSEVLEKKVPETELVTANAGMAIGSVSVQSAHIGYKAKLWKITKENGTEVSREEVNSSVYNPAPRSAVVGVATNDANAYNQIMEAIATNNIDYIREVAASLSYAAGAPEPAPAPAPPVVEDPPSEEPEE